MLVISYGDNISKTTYDTLAASDISDYLKPHFSVAIKPNLVVARPASEGATTHPEVVDGILKFLHDFGVRKLSIIESAWVGDDTKRAFNVCGYEPFIKKYGATLFDLKDDNCQTLEYKGMNMEICRRALETDFLINVPVLKAHCQTRLTCNMKNLKGCIPDKEKRRFHTLGLHKPIAALNALLKTHYCVVDGICGDLSFEEGGNPTYANRIVAGREPVLVDSFCAELIGYQSQDIEYLEIARKWGLGDYFSSETPVTQLGEKPANTATASRAAARYAKDIAENGACSACYAALVHALHRMGGSALSEKIHVGQGWRGQTGKLGIGSCTSGFSRHLSGCPPTALDVRSFLTSTSGGKS